MWPLPCGIGFDDFQRTIRHAGILRTEVSPAYDVAGSLVMSDVTRILSAIEQGDPHAAEQLLPLVYEELRRLAAFPGFEGMEIDFPMNLRIGTNNTVVQTGRFPADLLVLAGALGIDVAFTIYLQQRMTDPSDGTV